MFLNKFFHFLKGYVIILLRGSKTEQFLCMAAKSGLRLWGIRRTEPNTLTLSLSFADFLKIRPIARKTDTRIRIMQKSGLPVILKKYKKRYFLFGGAVLFAVFIVLSSQFIWSVELVGVRNADPEAISAALHDMGVYVGAPRWRVIKGKQAKNTLINRVDNITWAWVYLKGTKAVCEIYEGAIPPARLEEGTPCNIIAARDGIIKRIIATDGKRMVKPGDTVMAGDLLVSGVIQNESGEHGALVEAGGEILAKTWHERSGEFKLYSETKRPTGQVKRLWSVRLFSKEIPLYKKGETGFDDSVEQEEWYEVKLPGDNYLGVGLIKREIYELEAERTPVSYDMAVYAARCSLEEQIAGELLAGSEKVSESLVHRQIDDETVEVTLTMEFTEKIGVKAPIEITEENQE